MYEQLTYFKYDRITAETMKETIEISQTQLGAGN
jgi:hypothetical protein